MEYLISVIVSVFFWHNIKTNYFAPKWWFLSLIVGGLLSWNIYLTSHLSWSLFYFFLLNSSLFFSIFPYKNKSLTNDNNLNQSASFECSKTSISLLVLGVLFVLIDKRMILSVDHALCGLIIGNFIWKMLPRKIRLFESARNGGVELRGMGGNLSVDATLTSLTYAMILISPLDEMIKLALLPIAGISILITRASSGLFAFFFSSIYYFGIVEKNIYIIISFCLFGLIAVIRYKEKLLALSGRDWLWKEPFKIMKSFNAFFGMGNGNYRTLVRVLFPSKSNNKTYRFLWAHNDYLQLFMECGYIGLILLIASIVQMSIGIDSIYITFMICYGINAFSNFPTHMAPDSFLLTVFLKRLTLGV
jgi:hypothetical protein